MSPTAEELAKRAAEHIDIAALAKELVKQFQAEEHKDLWISREEHAIQHTFIRSMMDDIEERHESRNRIKERIIGSATISAFLAFVGYVGRAIINWMQLHLTIHT